MYNEIISQLIKIEFYKIIYQVVGFFLSSSILCWIEDQIYEQKMNDDMNNYTF